MLKKDNSLHLFFTAAVISLLPCKRYFRRLATKNCKSKDNQENIKRHYRFPSDLYRTNACKDLPGYSF